MLIWTSAHPWLTFIIAVVALVAADNAVRNICLLIAACHGYKEKDSKKEETDGQSDP